MNPDPCCHPPLVPAIACEGWLRIRLMTAVATVALLIAAPIASAHVVLAAPQDAPGLVWGLIGNDGQHLQEERDAGITAKTIRLSWRSYLPSENRADASYVAAKREEIRHLREAGLSIIVDLGLQDTPTWLHDRFPDSHYVDQSGNLYRGSDPVDNGDANLVFNPAIREAAAAYLGMLFHDLGTDFLAVRLGGGRYGELTYPPSSSDGHANQYWAFDARAQAASPVPGWRPGDPSPNGEAGRFLDWYLGSLIDYERWQIATVRRWYAGSLMMLFPSWGIRPGDKEKAVADNLDGKTSAERNGELARGVDFAGQVAAITDPGVIVTTTWLDADRSGDTSADPRQWSPVKYLATLAERNAPRLRLYGENTGQGGAKAMNVTAQQMCTYHLIGMNWYNENEMLSGKFATLDEYRSVIARYSAPQPPCS